MKLIYSLLAVALLSTATGCSKQYRAITHVRVHKDKAYLAYAERDEGGVMGASNDRSRVKRCEILPDNALKCEEDADVNRLLNPQEEGGAPAPAPAPAPAADAPAADAPADAPAADAAAAPAVGSF